MDESKFYFHQMMIIIFSIPFIFLKSVRHTGLDYCLPHISILRTCCVFIEKWSCEKAKLNPSQAISQMILSCMFVRKQQKKKAEEEDKSAMASNGIQFIV